MMCFRDRTYCGSPNCKNDCGRQFTDEDRAAAYRWWNSVFPGKGEEAPIAFSYFCGEPNENKAN